jgi:hypothetical protein
MLRVLDEFIPVPSLARIIDDYCQWADSWEQVTMDRYDKVVIDITRLFGILRCQVPPATVFAYLDYFSHQDVTTLFSIVQRTTSCCRGGCPCFVITDTDVWSMYRAGPFVNWYRLSGFCCETMFSRYVEKRNRILRIVFNKHHH